MEEFFEPYNSSEILMPWLEETQTTAFHTDTNALPSLPHRHACIPNAHNRMLQFSRMTQTAAAMAAPPLQVETVEQQKERSLKHMMVERMRREKHRQSFLALHQLLPLGTKGRGYPHLYIVQAHACHAFFTVSVGQSTRVCLGFGLMELGVMGQSDKQSILEMAGKEMEELQRCRDEVRKRNEEMEMEMMIVEKAELNLKVEFPASAVDSFLEVLKCLRENGCTATSIQSNFLHHHFAAALHFETRMRAAAEVERAVQRSLFEAEMKFRHQH